VQKGRTESSGPFAFAATKIVLPIFAQRQIFPRTESCCAEESLAYQPLTPSPKLARGLQSGSSSIASAAGTAEENHYVKRQYQQRRDDRVAISQ
jgi:hypothetical protein